VEDDRKISEIPKTQQMKKRFLFMAAPEDPFFLQGNIINTCENSQGKKGPSISPRYP
jgi:hypothetical protein